MAKPQEITLGDGTLIPILYEDRNVIAIDKPAGWMLAPSSWDRTGRNLQLALESSLQAGDFWARSRSLKYLRYVHRLDADTSGLLLLARTLGSLRVFQQLFENRRIQKTYLAVVRGVPREKTWVCRSSLAPDPARKGRMVIADRLPASVRSRSARPAETRFRVIQTASNSALVEASPVTGRTHQIRVHLAAAGHPVLGDDVYGIPSKDPASVSGARKVGRELALRAVELVYPDPFTGRVVRIKAPSGAFVVKHGFAVSGV